MPTNGFTRVLQGAGLTRSELATLYGVSRQSIHHWVTVAGPRGYTARIAQVRTAALLAAIERKVLPFAAVSREVRSARIARMAKTLEALKLAPAK